MEQRPRMTCPRCGSANADDRRFCSGCGAPLAIACPACGAPNRSDRFCGGCGPAIILQLGAAQSVSGHTLERGGQPLEHCEIDADSFAAVAGPAGVAGNRLPRTMGAVLLIPREPLAPGATYNVSIAAGGRNYSWSFLTAAK